MGIEWLDDQTEPTLACKGDMGPVECSELHREISDRITAGAKVRLDLSEVESCGTMFVQLLYCAAQSASADANELLLGSPPLAVQEALERVGMNLPGM